MNIQSPIRQFAAVILYLCAATAFGQATPEQTPPEQQSPPPAAPAPAPDAAPIESTTPVKATAPVETTAPVEATAPAEAAPAAGATPAPEAQPAVQPERRAGAKRIVVLPVEFVVYQKSVSGIEALPGETETAKFALGDAAGQFLRQDQRFQIVDLPRFQGDPAGLLREHVELFKVVANTALIFAQYGGKAWAEKKTNFDYTLGNGLSFVADASEADYAYIMGGKQIKQTGGSAFMQFLAAAGGVSLPGGGTFLFAGIVDLKTGDLKWINSRLGMEMFGMTGSDVTNPATAFEVVSKMFEGYPSHKHIQFPPF